MSKTVFLTTVCLMFLAASSLSAQVWEPDVRLTNEASSSNSPSVATSDDTVHVVWYDNRDSNFVMYYKVGYDLQPDNLVKNSNESEYIGDDVYNNDGTDQTKEQTVAPADTAVYHIRVENDGDTDDTITITGTGSVGGWTVSYHDALSGGTDITFDVTGSGWSIQDIDPGDYTEIRMEVVPDYDLPGDSTYDVLVTSTSEMDDTRLDAVGTSTTTELILQPDNQIKNSDEASYIADGIYNEDGEDQTKAQTVEPGNTVVYNVMIENDGNLSDTITVTGTGSVGGWTVSYYDALNGGTDITSDVTGSGWSIQDIDPGDYTEIRVEVCPDDSLPGDSTYDVLVTSTSDRDDIKLDAVKAQTTTQGSNQPDNLIKNSDEADYVGDDIYNTDGTDQAKLQNVGAGNMAIYHVKVENDGNLTDTIIVTGTASSASWDVKYFDAPSGGTDITAQVTLPTVGWSTGELTSGEFAEIRVEVTAVSASEGSSFDALVVSTSRIDDACKDAVKATATVGTGEVEEEIVPLVYSLDVSSLSSGTGSVIRYTLPNASDVTLSLYDAAGRTVKTFDLGMVEAGSHEVELGNFSLSKGVYFVNFISDPFTETAKLIIFK